MQNHEDDDHKEDEPYINYNGNQNNDAEYYAPEPADIYDDQNDEHLHIVNVSDAIANFLLPKAKEMLDSLKHMSFDDLTQTYSSGCSCGCYETHCILDSLTEGMDLESLQYIVENQCLSLNVLCYILAKLFNHAGTLSPPIRVRYKRNLEGGDYDAEMAEIEGSSSFCIGWVELTTANIDYLIDYLCAEHPAVVATWRNTLVNDATDEGTLLYFSFYGHAGRDVHLRWARKLLSVGCDPFACCNFEKKRYDSPFTTMLRKSYYDLAVDAIWQPTAPNSHHLKILINRIDDDEAKYDNQNLIQKILYHGRNVKIAGRLAEIKNTINLIIGFGIDMTHRDSNDSNVANYIYYYGYAELLADHLAKYDLPARTENKPRSLHCSNVHNPSPYAALFYAHRYSKAPVEIAKLCAEYAALKADVGALTAEQLRDNNGHTYDSLRYLINYWHIGWVIPELAEE